MQDISKETLEKAQAILGLIKAEDSKEELVKAEPTELEKAEAEKAAIEAKIEAIKNPKTEKADNSELIKAINDRFGALGTVLQAKDNEVELLKGEISKLVQFNETLSKRLGIVESTPMERKSIGVGAIERFEKAEGEEGLRKALEGKKVLSISKPFEKAQIAKILGQAAIDDFKANNVSEIQASEFYKAVGALESANSLGFDAASSKRFQEFFQTKNIIVTK